MRSKRDVDRNSRHVGRRSRTSRRVGARPIATGCRDPNKRTTPPSATRLAGRTPKMRPVSPSASGHTHRRREPGATKARPEHGALAMVANDGAGAHDDQAVDRAAGEACQRNPQNAERRARRCSDFPIRTGRRTFGRRRPRRPEDRCRGDNDEGLRHRQRTSSALSAAVCTTLALKPADVARVHREHHDEEDDREKGGGANWYARIAPIRWFAALRRLRLRRKCSAARDQRVSLGDLGESR